LKINNLNVRRIMLSLLIMFLVVSSFSIQTPRSSAASPESTYKYPFQNPKLTVTERVNDLLGRLTLDEKISLLHQYQAAIVRLGIPSFRTGSEGLHGVSWLGEATVFPQGTGFGNTWDTDLMTRAGNVVGEEMRGYNVLNNAHHGIDVWSPVIDLARDPRAGRAPEGMGEDPYLSGKLSTTYAQGMKGSDPLYYQTIPTLKHFAAYGNEANRSGSTSSIDPRNRYGYFFNAFEYAIEAGAVHSIMTSYNLVNGRPVMVMPELQDDLFDQWAPNPDDFFIVTDAGSPSNLYGSNAYYVNNTIGQAKAYADSILSGVASMTQGSQNPSAPRTAIYEALARGFIKEADIDKVVRPILTIRLHAGDLDVDAGNPFKEIKPSVINSTEHQAIALEAAEKQLVLLKNTANALPLKKNTINKVAVIGPNADEVSTDFYAATYPYRISVYDGVKKKLTDDKIVFTRGVDQIALQPSGTNRYMTAPTGNGGTMTAGATTVGKNETFDLYDFGWKSFLLRAHSNDKYVTTPGSTLMNTGRAPGVQDGQGTQEWYTYQNFDYVKQSDDLYTLRFPRSADKNGNNYVAAGASSPFNLSANQSNINNATKFNQVMVKSGNDAGIEAATGADAAIVVVGDQPMLNSRETVDRDDLTLPPSQEALINAVASVNPNTIVVVVASYPMAMSSVVANPNVKAILYSSHGGQEEGNAITNALFGDYAPAGRLNQTWYDSLSQVKGTILDYDIIKNNRTYQYFNNTPLFPFGYGLTYTTFTYSNFALSSPSMSGTGTINASVDVKNTGSTASDEVVQLYVHAQASKLDRPIKELRGFERIHLSPGETKKVTFPLKASDLRVWDVTTNRYVVETGNYDIMVGASSADIKATKVLSVNGQTISSRNLSLQTRAENYNDYEGVNINISYDDNDYMVSAANANSWAVYKDADLGAGFSNIIARISSTQATGTIEVRLGSPTGTLVGTIDASSTGGKQNWVTRTAAINANQAKGTQDVYLVFPSNNVNISWFNFANTVAQPSNIAITTTLSGNTRVPIEMPAEILQRAGTLQMAAQVLPLSASTPAVTWSVVDAVTGEPTTIATINAATGVLTGGSSTNGNVKVIATATLPDTSTITGSKVVAVNHQESGTIAAERVIIRSGSTINSSNEYLYHIFQYDNYGEIHQDLGTLQLTATVYPSNAANKNVNWTVTAPDGSPTELATISAGGLLTSTGSGNGQVKVTAKTQDNYNNASYSSLITIQGQGPKDAFSRIEGELYDSVKGTLHIENIGGNDNGLMLTNGAAGNYAKYAKVDLGNGAASFEARLSSGAAGGNITIRVDDPSSGNVLGTLAVTPTKDIYTFNTQSTLLDGAVTGIHDIYLVFDSNISVNWFEFTKNAVASGTLTGPTEANAGLSMDIQYGLANVSGQDVLAQDITITFDPAKLDFVSIKSVDEARFIIVGQKIDIENGIVRFLGVHLGDAQGSPNGNLANLQFTSKSTANAGITNIPITNAIIADGQGHEKTIAGSTHSVQINVIDRSALEILIADAEALYNSAVEGNLVGQYPAGSKALLRSAIDGALLVFNDKNATISQIQLATTSLHDALQAFINSVITKVEGDINGDNKVSVGDLAIVAKSYGMKASDAGWDLVKQYDFNGDGLIDIDDLVWLALRILNW